ncbi:hypothetical protein [Streptomyces fuscichromogenes]|uniref:Uncharacterized protein n=1 Tax=Streptomyces fuscichromogenes TaxID=1324013 RepID=A0A917XNI2_9ACTN|nr:hypothetical protein [Streptomyces fuscichromogenes]GGN43754.1 hypothetical protein GCM10011578_094110 [Streptomyces fuscichromogenes]
MYTVIEADMEVIMTWRNNARHPSGSGTRERINLKVGSQLNFGISSRTGEFQPGATPSIGAFEVSGRHLLFSNFTLSSTFVIENLEGGTELVKARPRQLDMVIPFEISRILIPSGARMIELTAFTPPPHLLGSDLATTVPESEMAQLDMTSKYFAVLVALCEPRLRGSSMAAVPSVQQVVERLRGVKQFRDANRSSINYHIDYLAEQKLPVSQWAKYMDEGRMHSKREALVAFSLRFDLVREEHLGLLPDLKSSRAWRH